ncbi:MAG: hypothetical protein RL328_1751 [Acidobacteriota bacterium]
MSAILVLGGAGYIGSHACKEIRKAGHLPVVLDDLSTGHERAVQYGPFVQSDIADGDRVRRVIRDYEIRDVMHFAAKAYVGESVVNPGKYFRENVAKTISLLDALVEARVERIIFSSTCATYGIPDSLPISESQAQCPVNPYGETKLFAEKMLRWHGQAHGLQSVALRYFNAAGADPDGELGESHNPETHLIPCAIQAAHGQMEHLDIFGTDYPTPDGTAIRDYTHVSDLARAHVLALEYLRQGGESTALNLGTGRGYSVMQVVDAVSAASSQQVPVKLKPRRAGDPASLVADASRARQVLGWTPEFQTLDRIVETAVNWHTHSASAHA